MLKMNYVYSLSVVGHLTSELLHKKQHKFGNTSDLYYNQLKNWERK